MSNNNAVYWLKRDFRLADNPALTEALANHKNVMPLFILEDSFLQAGETSAFHVHAVTGALEDLRKRLKKHEKDVLVLRGEVVEWLEKLYAAEPFSALYAHEEIGVNRTYQRDIAVREWCAEKDITFTELRQAAVFRGKVNRDKRHLLWKKFTHGDLLQPPSAEELKKLCIPKRWKDFNVEKLKLNDTNFSLTQEERKQLQPVSETDAEATLQSFLYERGIAYSGGISSPLTAFTAGSRLSVHFAWGTMTVRTAYQATQSRAAALKENDDADSKQWRKSLRAFLSRLHWHDHFIQRLETEPEMEFQALNPAYHDFEYDNKVEHLEAWKNGTTGFPMVDACIRCLQATGFVNFRMRAMLTSFACHVLHLDWRLINEPMARLYTDYEPGIHLAQLQMQAGVVGINTLRIYSPTKQIEDHDPDTIFVKQWVPELREFTPKEIIKHGYEPLGEYPGQIVDRIAAGKEMRSMIYAVRRKEGFREIANEVYEKHGSRKGGGKKKPRPKADAKKKATKKTKTPEKQSA